MKRQITPEDVQVEADRNYDLGRKHAREEMADILAAFASLYIASAHLRLRLEISFPKIKMFPDWDEHTNAMREAENAGQTLN